MLADYHMHTPLCRHAVGEPSEYAAHAVALGLPEIGFSDHSPMAARFDDWRMLREELPLYFEMIERARADYPSLPIRLGLEVDYLPGQEAWIEELAAMADWDYLIGSVHYITPDWDVDNPKWLGAGRWESQPLEEVWSLYFAACERAVRSRLFDFLGHPDLVKKFGRQPAGDLRPYYEPLIQAMLDTGTAIEINTAGLRNPAGEVYPSRQFLGLALTAGIPLLINSDAHKPQDVGRDFAAALKLARDVGYRETLRFEKRQRRRVSLPT
jgi:histidinol-phosphatase (PHP family)